MTEQETGSFYDFNFEPGLEDGLDAMGFRTPTPVQMQAIPLILEGKDLIAVAQTGTGKTAAFLLPVLNKLAANPNRPNKINTLVISPTRELALQIDRQLEGFAYFTPVTSMAVYGGGDGSDFVKQQRAIKRGTDFIIATPGKLLTHLNLGYADLSQLQHLILDEADKMLDMGFYEDILRIVSRLPKERQTLLFSATMPPKIRSLSKEILNNPSQISLAISKPAAGIKQLAYMVYDNQKYELLERILEGKDLASVLIFSSTKTKCKQIAKNLIKRKHTAAAINSDLDQDTREEVLLQFRSKKLRILVATDILARGIDIDSISLVVNFDVPGDAEDYVHRIGRTARAAQKGTGITFITPDDQHKFLKIEELIEQTVEKPEVPADLGPTPEYKPRKRGGGFKRKKKRYSNNNRRDNRGGNSSNKNGGQSKSYSKPNNGSKKSTKPKSPPSK